MSIISKCKEPWIYWWLWLPFPTRKRLAKQYFPGREFPAPNELKTVWEKEGSIVLGDNEWLQLAQTALIYRANLSDTEKEEIWRQVYRIASQRI